MELNRPEVVAEVSAAFDAYERALVDHDVAAMNAFFWHAPQTVRYGIAEIQHGGEAISAWRETCVPVPASRKLHRTVVTTFGKDFATVSTEFLPAPAVTNSSSTTTRFATTTAPATTCAVVAGAIAARVTPGATAVIASSVPRRGVRRWAPRGS